MQVIECNPSHSESILAILNDAIVNTTALYDYKPRTPETMTTSTTLASTASRFVSAKDSATFTRPTSQI
jgi:L-amino acid N-acyltransferase YncA